MKALKSLNLEWYFNDTKVDYPLSTSATNGFITMPLNSVLGGTISILFFFLLVFLTTNTISLLSFSGKALNSIFYLSSISGHFSTLAVYGILNSLAQTLPVIILQYYK